MGQNYTAKLITGTEDIDVLPIQLDAPAGGEIVTALVASDDPWTYSSEELGFYRSAGLNLATNQYEKLFPVANAFAQMWFKSDLGIITMEWDVLINATA
jgi:hypothetical protein